MNVLVVSGIWPPDVGGPASHAPDVAAFLHGRGHHVEVLTTASAPPAPEPYPVHWVSRSIPKGAIHLRTGLEVARLARAADVIYTTGMFGRSSGGAALARRPYVLKLTGDPAFERSRWRGRTAGDVMAYQEGHGDIQDAVLRVARDVTVRRAAHVICPSAFLRDLAVTWGVRPDRITVVPNAAATGATPASGRDDAPGSALVLVFAGRLGPQKNLDLLLRAVAEVGDVRLIIAGDGAERERLQSVAPANVEFVGSRSREEVLSLFAAADAMVLPSAWENFPHTVVEALGAGTPVIATRVGGVGEAVTDGENGLLVEADDADGLRRAIQTFRDDPALRDRLRRNAATSARRYAPAVVYGEIEAILSRVAR